MSIFTLTNDDLISITYNLYSQYINLKKELEYVTNALKQFPVVPMTTNDYLILSFKTNELRHNIQKRIKEIESEIYSIQKEIGEKICRINFDAYEIDYNTSAMFTNAEYEIAKNKTKLKKIYRYKNTDGESIIKEQYYINNELFTNWA